MWRHPRNTSAICRVARSVKNARRGYAEETTPPPPTSPPGGGGGGVFLKLVGLTAVAAGGATAYAWYDDNFRRKVEDTVPYSREALKFVFSALPVEAPGQERSASLERAEDMPSFPRKVAAVPKQSEPPLASAPSKPVKTDAPVASKKADGKKSELSVAAPALPSKADLERRIADEAAANQLENVALESLAAELQDACRQMAQRAAERHLAAVEAINMHREQLKKAMKSGTESGSEWDSVSRALDQKSSLVTEAERSAEAARAELEKLSTLLQQSRENSGTKSNPVLISAQTQVNDTSYKLDKAKAERQSAESSMKLVREFRDLVDKGRKQFQKELSSIVPDASLGNKGKLSEDELNALIAHAHRRIEQLQIRLAESEALEEDRVQQALVRQRQEDEVLTETVVQREVEKERSQEALNRQKWESEVLQELEEKLRQELSRQSAAHNDHLADVLRVQRRELSLQYQDDLREAIVQERVKFSNEIGDSMARLGGIEAAVEARAQMERTGRKAQELWLACQTLVRSLTTTDGKKQKSLGDDLRAVKEAGNGQDFVDTLVDSIPQQAVQSGVKTETDLLDRFPKVKKICRRVSMVDETGGSLAKYFVSFLQSLFILERAKNIGLDDELDPEKLDTFTILNLAEKYLNENDLEQAVRFMRQLRGQPRVTARDWVNDAILFLETRQAADALLAHASACGIGSLLSSITKEPEQSSH